MISAKSSNGRYKELKEITIKEQYSLDTKGYTTINKKVKLDNINFNINSSIVNNKYCDLGTALMIFYDADGYRLLNKNDEQTKSQWYKFISFLYKKIFKQ